MPFRAVQAGLIPLATVVLGLSGCAGHEPARAHGHEVTVRERDFRIRAPATAARAGEVTLAVHNRGPDSHELIVVRAGRGRLPLRRDGITVDEHALEKRIPATLEPEKPGVHHLRVHLAPGRYELICNMSGHYLGGMRTRLVVQ